MHLYSIVPTAVQLILVFVSYEDILCLCGTDALIKRFARGLWDHLMYQLVISKQARIPIKDSFIARRIAGPGLASEYFYQVRGGMTSFIAEKYRY